MPYSLLARPSAQRELDDLPKAIADGIRKALHALAADPRSSRFDVKPMKAVLERPPLLRLRIGDYRIILQVFHEAEEILILRIGRRETVYRGLLGVGD